MADACASVLRGMVARGAASSHAHLAVDAAVDGCRFCAAHRRGAGAGEALRPRPRAGRRRVRRLAWPQDTTDRLVDLLRGELRGSDVLGLVGERRVVVLLIETHESAVGTVVRRLRERLGRAIPELKVPTLILGQAAFSSNCATADALLSEAAVNAETIKVPA